MFGFAKKNEERRSAGAEARKEPAGKSLTRPIKAAEPRLQAPGKTLDGDDDNILFCPPTGTIMPLSTKFLQKVSSLGCCPDCASSDGRKGASEANAARGAVNENALAKAEKYDMVQLGKNSTVSSLVLGPMVTDLKADESNVELVLAEYQQSCSFYKVTPNAGVLTCFRFHLPSLRVSSGFSDTDMLALVEVLLRHSNGALRHICRLDFALSSAVSNKKFVMGKPGLLSHGALTLAKLLQTTKYMHEVRLNRNRLGSFGASALFVACAGNPSIQRLAMRRCRIGERGGLAFAEFVSKCPGLMDIDLSSNGIGFRGTAAIEQAVIKRHDSLDDNVAPLTVNLEGNLVLQEIFNGVTHGLGIILALVGASLLSARVQGKPPAHVISCAVYSSSLVVLYTSSTLYHSFFSLQNTKYIFEVMDKCAIYILIAGSYTPFLKIVMRDSEYWATGLSSFIWSCAILGISVEAKYPTYKHKALFSLAMYLGMGWSCMVCLPEITRNVPDRLIHLMVLGGSAYTLGVPFFVRNHNLDHCIWHLFVLTGSAFHWFGIYYYVAPFGEDGYMS